CWAAHDVADLVAAAAEARHEGLIDRLHAGLEVALQDAVELEVLTGGDADGAVAPAACCLVVCQVALGAYPPTWNTGPDHQLVVAVQAAPARLFALVAVVLLIDPVKLQDLGARLVKRRRVLGQLGRDRAAQGAAGLFDQLDLRGLSLAAAVHAHVLGDLQYQPRKTPASTAVEGQCLGGAAAPSEARLTPRATG